MVDLLFVRRGEKTFGPFSGDRLRGLAAAGQLRLTDSLWKEGMAKAVVVAKVLHLFPDPPAPLPPVPAAEIAPPAPVEEPPAVTLPAPPAPEVPDLTARAAPAETAQAGGPPKQPEQARKRQASAVAGAVILSQDGVTVHYRKKCPQCGFEEAARSRMRIGLGVIRDRFFCPKCRKSKEVQIQGR